MIFYIFDNVRLKISVLFLLMILPLMIIPVYALHVSTFLELKTDKILYDGGDIITISGIVNNTTTDNDMNLHIYYDRENIFSDEFSVFDNGTFSHEITTGNSNWNGIGEYLLIASHNGDTLRVEFNYTGNTPPIITTDTFEVDAGTFGIFDVEYTIQDASVENMTLGSNSSTIIIEIDSEDSGNIILNLPRNLIDAIKQDGSDANFIILVNGEDDSYREISADSIFREIQINFHLGNFDIIIIGS